MTFDDIVRAGEPRMCGRSNVAERARGAEKRGLTLGLIQRCGEAGSFHAHNARKEHL